MLTKTMSYEDIKLSRPSKSAVTNEVQRTINNMPSSKVLWFLVVKHKFGVLITVFAIYVAFTSFGTLLVGLAEGLK
jgi:hypothetical protein